jgi:hypothetical protein
MMGPIVDLELDLMLDHQLGLTWDQLTVYESDPWMGPMKDQMLDLAMG